MIWNPRSTGVVIAPGHCNVGADYSLRHRAKKERWAEAEPEAMALEHNPLMGFAYTKTYTLTTRTVVSYTSRKISISSSVSADALRDLPYS
jgi:hypothetical protein